jgi:hypothetical protein
MTIQNLFPCCSGAEIRQHFAERSRYFAPPPTGKARSDTDPLLPTWCFKFRA